MILDIHPTTLASRLANEQLESNLRALRQSQPELARELSAAAASDAELEWVFGRDRALTARRADGRWLAECSLPRRAGREMLRRLSFAGAVGCFLAPTHAAQIAAALEVMRPEQAIVALIPELNDLAIMLRCENFSAAIDRHRLWFVAGPQWSEQLVSVYEAQVGLAPPAQFVRVPATPADLLEPLIAQAQEAISQITLRRSAAAQALRAKPWHKPSRARLCVVAPSHFRLWNDVGHVLISAAEEASQTTDNFAWTLFDADDPACSSPLGLATIARECSALLTANTARCDLPEMLPDEMPWITWVTNVNRIPSASSAGMNDRLIVVDTPTQRRAVARGWSESQIDIGGWTAIGGPSPSTHEVAAASIIADTSPLDVPEELNEYSSHALLWEAVRDELLRNPLSLGQDVRQYLTARIRKLEIAEDGFPWQTFIARLVVPAFQQGVAKAMVDAKLPLRLYGQGWQQIPDFAQHAHGPIESREHLAAAVRAARTLIHVWPGQDAHPIEFSGVPVVRPPLGGRMRAWIDAARHLLQRGPAAAPAAALSPWPQILRKLLCGI